MRKVYKYVLASDNMRFELPVGAEFCSASMQAGLPVLYFLVDAEEERTEKHYIAAIPTGQPVPGFMWFLATVVSTNGLVWHIFDGGNV